MAKQSHLTIEERVLIQDALNSEDFTFRKIADKLNRNQTTISKEIRNHCIVKTDHKKYNPCIKYTFCKKYGTACEDCTQSKERYCRTCDHKCFKYCDDFHEAKCPKLSKPPYVCNGCISIKSCRLEKHIYDAKYAQKTYENTLRDSRECVSMSPEELKFTEEFLLTLLKQGQSIHHICVNNADVLMVSERAIYDYIERGRLNISTVNMVRSARFKVRKKKKLMKIDKKCFIGRTYDDFNVYMSNNPDQSVVEIDSVEGNKGGKVLLTIYFCDSSLMLAYIREANTSRSVTDIFNNLYGILGHEEFVKLFPVILADRGSEFTNPTGIECNSEGEMRTRVFYTDPMRPNQKGSCEVAHEMIRRILPKGKSFDNLTQEDVSLMMSHINSYKRKKLGDRSAYELFSFIHGEDILLKLEQVEIPANNIQITPKLLKK